MIRQGRQYCAYPIQGRDFELNGRQKSCPVRHWTVSNLHGMVTGWRSTCESGR
ncbi:hypothetical protein [Escherichia coli]|uniref:hypothetical protein n=1 Tax=Escherichia coli TaxID=562 RepID=UPI0035B5E306